MKPLIGIVSKPSLENDMWNYVVVVDNIRSILVKNNALVTGILPVAKRLVDKDDKKEEFPITIEDRKDLEAIVSKLDGVVLQGGLVSDPYEEEIAKICIAKDIPLLGICAGFNNLVRALGGHVSFDSKTFHNQYGSSLAHEVEIIKDSKLYNILGETRITVNSIHTSISYANDIKEYKVVAKCPVDDSIEAIELPNKRFVMGIKWHPDLMESMDSLFAEFVKTCCEK